MDSNGEKLTVGKLITFQLYWNMIGTAYNGLAGIVNDFTKAGGAAQRILSMLDSQPDIKPDTGRDVTVRGGIKLEHVDFHYQMRPENKVLKDLSLTIEPGQVQPYHKHIISYHII